ncbi:MAG: BON domain-containing protein [Deltaproteobacteria bacterium]|nr:BON domain-containing protein [Deltaproteobacteria bacterium]
MTTRCRFFSFAILAALLAGCGATPMRRGVGEVWRDEKIKTALHWRMARDKQVNGSGVNVDVYRGVVALGGRVANDGERQRAEALARRTRGVVKVENHLAVMDAGDPRFMVANRKAVAPSAATPKIAAPVIVRTPKAPTASPSLGSEEPEYADLAPEPKAVSTKAVAKNLPTASPTATKPTVATVPKPAKPSAAATATKPVIDPNKGTATRYLDAGAIPPARQVHAKPQSVADPSPAWMASRANAAPKSTAAPRATTTGIPVPKAVPAPERVVAPSTPDGDQNDLAREAAEELKKLKAMP